MESTKFLRFKNNFGLKTLFGLKNWFGSKNLLRDKKFGGGEFLEVRIFGAEKNLSGVKNFGVKNYQSQNIFGQKRIWVPKNLDQKKVSN